MKFKKEKLKLRLYQQSILNTAAQKNTLVILPTGLGKTHIAVALAGLRLEEGKKILVLAPTVPLVAQHRAVFSQYFEPSPRLTLLTGKIPPAQRVKLWLSSAIIFATPQTIKFDLIARRISLEGVSLLVLDEGHKAAPRLYAYNYIAKKYREVQGGRILALTASPGANLARIKALHKKLGVEEIEMRSREDLDVRPYVHKILFEHKVVKLPAQLVEIKVLLKEALVARVSWLRDHGWITFQPSKVTKKSLIALQQRLLKKFLAERKYGRPLSVCASALKISHALNLLQSESLTSFTKYLEELFRRGGRTRIAKDLEINLKLKKAYSLGIKALGAGLENPKLSALAEVIKRQLEQKEGSKILLFTEFRQNISPIVRALENIPRAKVHKFIGQADRGEPGMSQETQAEVLAQFKRGGINCLVCTSVAEEGLDIPAVDLVIFYTPIPSAIRRIQRVGRTGRTELGRVLILITKGSADEAYHWIAIRKQRRMEHAIKGLKVKEGLGQWS